MSKVIGIIQSKDQRNNQVIEADSGIEVWQKWIPMKDKKSRLIIVYPSGHITLDTWDKQDPDRALNQTLAHGLPAL